MRSTAFLHVRLSPEQHERVRNRMEALGYRTISAFVRDLLLKDDLSTLTQLREIRKILEEAHGLG